MHAGYYLNLVQTESRKKAFIKAEAKNSFTHAYALM